MKKICSKCGKLLKYSEFYKNKRAKDGLMSVCKYCCKLFRDTNKEKIAKQKKKWRDSNIDTALLKSKEYYLKNRASINIKHRLYNNTNSVKVKEYNAKYCKSNAKYKTFKDKLTVDESSRLANDGVSLEVKCKYCNQYFIPTVLSVKRRTGSLNDTQGGSQFLYCSEGCKKACPTYYQKKYTRRFKKVTSREVQPELRKLVLERDNWECQICGANINDAELHCHHLTGVELNPVESADMDNCVTLCKDCHKKVHKLPGCRYSDYRRKECKED